MPIFDSLPADLSHTAVTRSFDALPAPLVSYGTAADIGSWDAGRHAHRNGQLLYVARGVMHCEVEDSMWIVPQHRALWIPPNAMHVVHAEGAIISVCTFLAPEITVDLPARCSTLTMSPLLRELLLRTPTFRKGFLPDSPEGRIVAVLLDELRTATIGDFFLPMPRDAKLRELAEMVLSAPQERLELAHYADHLGMSRRTITRRFTDKMGMSFGQWRRRLHAALALERLSRGDSVKLIAFDLGYNNVSSFVTMFRKLLGKPPTRYLSEQEYSPANVEDETTNWMLH